MTQLKDLTEVEPMGETDRECLEQLRDVLARHGALDRFGITLLHEHFPLSGDEQLMETCDPETRTLTIQPTVLDPEEGGRVIETNWQLSPDGDVIAGLVCKVGCFVDLKDNHKRTHERVNG